MILTQTECAYIAGIIDGEGCISMRKVNLSTRTATVAKICIRMTHKPIIKWLKRITRSGSTHLDQVHRRFPHWKNSHEVVWHGKSARFLLQQVFPYLIIKTRQAEILIEWVDIQERERTNVGGRGKFKYKTHVLSIRERLIDEMRRLNQRGNPRTRSA